VDLQSAVENISFLIFKGKREGQCVKFLSFIFAKQWEFISGNRIAGFPG
jgi:hypothetical protein